MPSAPREAAPPFFNQSAKDHALSSDVGTHWIQQSVLRLFRQEWVEWRFAFDVHCNDFVPLFLLLCARSPQAHTQTSTPPEPQPRISFMTPYFLFAVHALAASQLASARFDCYCHCFEFAGTYCNTCCCRCCFPKVSSCRSSAMCSMRSPSVANTTSHSSATASFHTCATASILLIPWGKCWRHSSALCLRHCVRASAPRGSSLALAACTSGSTDASQSQRAPQRAH